MQSKKYHIEGTTLLICHNARLADPLDEWTKKIAEISKKTKKTDDDHEELAHREFLGSLYANEDNEPVIPGGNIERMLRDAAKLEKLGKQVMRGLFVPEDSKIIYDGPRDPEKLWQSKKHRIRASVGVGQKRVIRTRPGFSGWSLEFTVVYDETVLDERQIDRFVDVAGRFIGLGDWRPKHGRFVVVAA